MTPTAGGPLSGGARTTRARPTAPPNPRSHPCRPCSTSATRYAPRSATRRPTRLLAGENAPGPLRLHLLPHPRRHHARSAPAPCSSSATRPRSSPSPTPPASPPRSSRSPRSSSRAPCAASPARTPCRGSRAPPFRRRPPHRSPRRPGRRSSASPAGWCSARTSLYPALVVEPTGPVGRPGRRPRTTTSCRCSVEQGFHRITRPADRRRRRLQGWSVLLAMGKLHAVLQPGTSGRDARRLVAGAPAAAGQRRLAGRRQPHQRGASSTPRRSAPSASSPART